MLMHLTDEKRTVIVTLSSVWLWHFLPHGAGRAEMPTGVAGHCWRWGEPAPSGVSRR
jgi:hypothetical protein